MSGSIGPSTTQSPYILPSQPNVHFASVLSVGDQVGTKPNGDPWVMVGIPDGLGAYDNGDGTFTVLMNHEIPDGEGVVREHGSAGAFVSELTIDKATLEVLHAEDLGKTIFQDNDGDGVYTQATTVLQRLCSADLAAVSAFYDPETGLGTQARIFLDGEEIGAEGRAWAWVATGPEAGNVYELPGIGNASWENLLANPYTGAKTVVIGNEDSTPGQLFMYFGDKQATGTEVEKAGLVGGALFGIVADGIGHKDASGDTSEPVLANPPTEGSFHLTEIAGAATMTGAEIETAADAAGVSEWWRPEDGAWDTVSHNRYYFVTTAAFGSPSRLWALDFDDPSDPSKGGSFHMLLDGSEGQQMMDNLTVAADGTLILLEDVGDNPRDGKVWHYDPATDTLTEVGHHDPARFGSETEAATPPFNQDEESSGVIDVSNILGDADTRAYLLDTQAHYDLGGELVEGGQLQVMYVDDVGTGTRDDDLLNGSGDADHLNGLEGNDTVLGGSGADSLRGSDGRDLLAGWDGDDKLHGGFGGDTLVGGLGADMLIGGGGHDAYVWNSAAEGGDRVHGFVHGADKIVVSASGFGHGVLEGANLAVTGQFIANATGEASGTVLGQFIYDTDGHDLWWDADGTGAGEHVLIAHFTGKPELTASDITVIA